MARKVFNTEETVEQDILSEYLNKKLQLEQLDKEVKKLSEIVKEKMETDGQKFVEKDGYKISRIVSTRVKWEEDKLLQKAKSYNLPELVETVEQVNVPVLEKYVLDGEININDLEDCQQITEVTQLRVTKIKEKIDV